MIPDVEKLAELSSAEKSALLAKLLKKEAVRPESFSLSFAQQRLWVLENTDNWFLYVGYYARRMRSLLKLGPREQVKLIKTRTVRRQSNPQASDNQPPNKQANPMKVYFSGPDFKPRLLRGGFPSFGPANNRSIAFATGIWAGPHWRGRPHVQVLAAKNENFLART